MTRSFSCGSSTPTTGTTSALSTSATGPRCPPAASTASAPRLAVIWLEDAEQVVLDADGKPDARAGIPLDITEHRSNRLRLESINAVLSAPRRARSPSEIVRRARLVRGLRGVRSASSRPRRADMRFLDSVTDCELDARPPSTLPGADVPDFFAILERGEPSRPTARAPSSSAACSPARRAAGRVRRCAGQPGGTSARDPVDRPHVPCPSRRGRCRASPTWTPARHHRVARDRAESDLRRRDDILSTVSRAATALLAGSGGGPRAWPAREPSAKRRRRVALAVFELGRREDGALTASQRPSGRPTRSRPSSTTPTCRASASPTTGSTDMAAHIARNQVHAADVQDLPGLARRCSIRSIVVSLLVVPIVVDGAPGASSASTTARSTARVSRRDRRSSALHEPARCRHRPRARRGRAPRPGAEAMRSSTPPSTPSTSRTRIGATSTSTRPAAPFRGGRRGSDWPPHRRLHGGRAAPVRRPGVAAVRLERTVVDEYEIRRHDGSTRQAEVSA